VSVDLIIHAGDYKSKNLLDQLRDLGNLKGVYGNMDPEEVRRELPEKEISLISILVAQTELFQNDTKLRGF
jgi:predicted phosphodiesterase